MNASENELEQRLRALFSDSRLGVEPPADATPAILAGARRRRRRRKLMVSASGAVCALAVVSGGLFVVKIQAGRGAADLSASSVTVPDVPPTSLLSSPTSAGAPVPVAPPVEEPSSTAVRATSEPRKPHRPAPSPERPAQVKVTKGPLLTADGLGNLKLGMTQQQLTDQGLTLTPVKESAGCTYYDVAGAGVPAATAVLSPDAGVVVVKPDVAAHTPEGVGAGSAKEDVAAAYPGTSTSSDGLVAPTDDGAYHFTLTASGSVASIDVRTTTQPCTA